MIPVEVNGWWIGIGCTYELNTDESLFVFKAASRNVDNERRVCVIKKRRKREREKKKREKDGDNIMGVKSKSSRH